MTTPNTHFEYAWSDASGKTIGASDLTPAAASSKQPGEVLTLALPSQTGPAAFETDFDTLVGDLEATPAGAQLLADGRRWVGQQFYGQAPSLAGLRLAAGLSQRQLAEACGIAQPHVSRYEAGRHEPSLSLAARMAAALGVGLDALYAAWATAQQPGKAVDHGH